ncbi:P-loop containing nucleoside triphosphate hydrolase protein [Multifurca ochricompacta]|uniref:Peroxisomal ATPase PEX6 n=1 Tax=Multifurca ochricompacta TaxID=376703 RepID=A0AAD4QND0_9AGAM|nr:P-loop containing nucleoside triphosphate hydrolase protein [Multifurca ochricompacta]
MAIKNKKGIAVTIKLLPNGEKGDVLQVGNDLWNALVSASEHKGPTTVSVDLLQSHTEKARRQISTSLSVTCWAVLCEDVQASTLGVPPNLVKQYPNIFAPIHPSRRAAKTHSLSAVQLIPLQEVFVQALSSSAYSRAKANVSSFEDWMCRDQRILRQDSIYCLGSQDSHDAGYAQKSRTLFTLLPPAEDPSSINGHHLLPSFSPNDVQVELDDEDLEIDERFLAGSLVLQPSSYSHQNDDPTIRLPHLAHRFTAKPLSMPAFPEQDDHTMYVRTVDLPKVGVLDGDWAIVQLPSSRNRRIVRLEASDDIVDDSGIVRASPILLHNIDPELQTTPTYFCILAAPDGIRSRNLPTAKAVTVARVASRLSTNRIYQPLVLQGLKSFFDGKKRLIKQGDLLAIKVDLNQLQYLQAISAGDGAETVAPGVLEGQSTNQSSSEQIIYFTVTNIDCDPPSTNNAVNPSDVHLGLSAGELGCWVDTAITRMTQTGLEHARIPDASGFLIPRGTQDPGEDAHAGMTRGNNRAFTQLLGLSQAALMPQALTFDIPISMLLKGARGTGKFTTTVQVAQRLGMHIFEVNCYDFLGENDTKTEGLLRARFEQATLCSPCVLVMRHLEAFTQTTQPAEPGKDPAIVNVLKELLQDLYGSWRLTGYPILVFGTTAESGRVPPTLVSCFKHEVEFEAPDEAERSAILDILLASKRLAPDVSVIELARRTAAFVAGDLASLVIRASYVAVTRVMQELGDGFTSNDIFSAGISLTNADFEIAMDEARSSYSQNIGAPKIPNVSWDDVGGLADVKADILDTVQLPLDHPELFASDLKKRSGILLYGPPGTGKTLLAKAGPELLNMYIGESEANVRRVFQRARDARPCVVFFDELDSVAPKRGAHGDSGGVMDRIVSQLLAELDGISSGAGGDVFVIGATNRPDLLDPALLRPGRFDRMLYLGVSDTDLTQLKILQALTRKFRLDPELDLMTVAQQCTFNFTGADFYALCADALLKAMSRKAEEIDARIAALNAQPSSLEPALVQWPSPLTPQYYLAEIATPEEIAVIVTADDFAAALRELVPSVSQAEMAHYSQIRERFSRADGANANVDVDVGKQESNVDPKGKGKGRDDSVEEDEIEKAKEW